VSFRSSTANIWPALFPFERAISPILNNPQKNGTILTRQQFSALLSKSLKFSGIEGGQYKAHSFRIGGATALSLAGYSDEEIQNRGRWRSAVFKSYIRLPHTPV
jgi:site-specific recombinase XerD